ncbi:MAG: hypothetical protein H6607_07260 [Flavobacteriales bacterium]|nr:hypothetical protein [Flavobacteriales bacterium]
MNLSKNELQKPQNMASFYALLDDLIKGRRTKLNITHIGDSHIQADFLSHTTRKLFQKTFGNGGRGFVFPFRLIRSNSPLNIKISYNGQWEGCRSILTSNDCNFGVCGATATTFDSSSSFKINPNFDDDMNYEFSKLKLFSYHTPLSFDIALLDADSNRLDYDYQPISSSVSEIFFTKNQDSLWLGFEKFDDQQYFQLFGMSFENENPGIIYNAIGLNGAYAKSYLRNNFFDDQFASLESDLVIISLGTNDAYMSEKLFCKTCFKSYYRELVGKIISQNPAVSLLFTTPGDFYVSQKYHNNNINEVVDGIYELADEFGAAVWDFNAVMGGSYSVNKWRNEGLARGDLVHFTEEGYVLQGRLLYQTIIDAYEKRFD